VRVEPRGEPLLRLLLALPFAVSAARSQCGTGSLQTPSPGGRSANVAVVEFTLTYDGPLATRQSGNLRAKKHELRQAFHPQLAELWTHQPLAQFRNAAEPGGRQFTTVEDLNFTSIAHQALRLKVGLDITMLRPEAPGETLIAGGDIDNRLKTLFDALTVPKPGQLPRGWKPEETQDPLHCLLSDDQLISEVSVTTDRLLAAQYDSHVKLLIRVKLAASSSFAGYGILLA